MCAVAAQPRLALTPMTPTPNFDSGTAVRAEKSPRVLAARFQISRNIRHPTSLVRRGLARGVGDRQVTLARDMAGAVRVPIREFDGVGVAGRDHYSAEVMHGVV